MGWPTQAQVDTYTAMRAPVYGIDPGIAVRVRRSESEKGFVGDNGTSFGPFQLHIGGGLGDTFITQTGLDPRNSSTWQAQVDFALQQASQTGWAPFHGAAKAGISTWEGIKQTAGQIGHMLTYYFPLVGYSGNVRETYHTPGAADLFAAAGTEIRNIVSGRVTVAGSDNTGGNNILIRGDDGRDYYYAHMQDKPKFSVGDYIPGGAIIGKVGNTGNAANTGAHLHIGIGYGISTGTGASGGAGLGFDAQSFLSGLLSQGGADGHPIGDIIGAFDPGAITGAIGGGFKGGIDSIRQDITNYVQDRAASILILSIGILLIVGSALALAFKSDAVRTVVKMGASKVNPLAGVAAEAAL